jgi:hypothetical protein
MKFGVGSRNPPETSTVKPKHRETGHNTKDSHSTRSKRNMINRGSSRSATLEERTALNYDLIEPFVRWLQTLSFGGVVLRRGKKNLSAIDKNYVILTNGSSRMKSGEAVTVWAKVQRLPNSKVGIEIVDADRKKNYIIIADKSKFRFEAKGLEDDLGETQLDVIDITTDAVYPVVIGYKLDSLDSSLKDHLSAIASEQEEEFNEGRETSSIISAPTPLKSMDSDPVLVNISSNSEDHQIEDGTGPPQEELVTLQSHIVHLQARILLQHIQLEKYRQEIRNLKSDKNSGFNIQDYVLRKVITTAKNGRIYGVEHLTNGTRHSVKEVIISEADTNSDAAMDSLARELSVVKALQATKEKSRHILQFEDVFFENTPLRASCYILTAPAALSFRDFVDTLDQQNDKVLPVVAYQLLTGLNFLDTHTGCIHGNLNFDNIVVSFIGDVMISSFDHSFKIGEQADTSTLVDDIESINYKHTFLLLANQLGTSTVIVKPSIDLFAVGLIMYRLLTRTDLFGGCESFAERNAITVPQECKYLVSPFLVAYDSPLRARNALKWDIFDEAKKTDLRSLLSSTVN